MVQQHVAHRRVAHVLHGVSDLDRGVAQVNLDTPSEQQLLTVHGGLEHLALRPQRAAVIEPRLTVAHEPRREAAHAAMEREALGGPDVWLAERLGVILAGPQRVVEATGDHEAAAPRPEPRPVLVLREPRRHDTRRRVPRHGHPGQLAAADVEGPVHQDVEGQRAAPELEQAHAAPSPVTEGHQAHAPDLVEPAHPPDQLRPRERPTEHRGHGAALVGQAPAGGYWRTGFRSMAWPDPDSATKWTSGVVSR